MQLRLAVPFALVAWTSTPALADRAPARDELEPAAASAKPAPSDSPVIAADLDACRGKQVGEGCRVGEAAGACVATDAPWGGELIGGPAPAPTLVCDLRAAPTAASAPAPPPAAPASTPAPSTSEGLCRVSPDAPPALLVLLLLVRRRRAGRRVAGDSSCSSGQL